MQLIPHYIKMHLLQGIHDIKIEMVFISALLQCEYSTSGEVCPACLPYNPSPSYLSLC